MNPDELTAKIKEQKYPPGVRFVFLLALSAFTAFLSIHLASAGVVDRSGNWVLFAISTVMSLSVFVIALLPWAKDRRKRTFVTGLALFLVGTLFLIADLDRAGWLYFLPAIFLACSMLYLTRHGFVPNHQRHPVGMSGYILLGMTILLTMGLTIVFRARDDSSDVILLLFTPVWLLISGILLKIAGSGKKHLAPIKPLLFTGELSILYSFVLLAFLAAAVNSGGDKKDLFYIIAVVSSFLFSICVFFRGLLGNWLCGLLFGKPETEAAKTPDTSIHEAAGIGSVKAVKQHLAAGTNVNAKDVGGETPLHHAALMGHKKIAELLISAGADANAKDLSNETPLDRAVRFKRTEITKLLHEHEANPSTVDKENTGLTPLIFN